MSEGILKKDNDKYVLEYKNEKGTIRSCNVKKTNVSKDIIENNEQTEFNVIFKPGKKPKNITEKGKEYVSYLHQTPPSQSTSTSQSSSASASQSQSTSENNISEKSNLPKMHSQYRKPASDSSSPYNFISINDEVIEDECEYTFEKFEGLSGKIECEIETKTPIFIGSGKEKYNYFFSYDNDSPVIPSSSLKGMLRSLVEILSFGKITNENSNLDRYLVYRDVARTNFINNQCYYDILTDAKTRQYKGNAGLIVKIGNQYKIIPSKYIAVRRKYLKQEFQNLGLNYSENFTVSNQNNLFFDYYDDTEPRKGKLPRKIKKAFLSKTNQGGYNKECKILITGKSIGNTWIQEQKRDYIMYSFEKDKSKWLDVPESVIRDFKLQKTQFQMNAFNKNPNSNDLEIVNKQPVFYTMKDGHVNFFGRCKMMRLPYNAKIKEFVPKCHFKNIIDFADKIFGYTAKEKEKESVALAGKVFCSDAKLTDTPVYAGRYETILGTPSPTSYQLYLEQDKNNNNNRKLFTYNSVNKTKIRGHKMYWHKNQVDEPEANPNEKIKTFMENVLEKNNKFKFTIEFINMSEEELGVLMLALNLWGENYCHKIGMAKPYGLGSIKISSNNFSIINRKKRYNKIIDEDGNIVMGIENQDYAAFINKFEKYMSSKLNRDYNNDKRIQQLKKILDFNEADKNLNNKVYMQLPQFRNKKVLPEL